MSAVVYLPDDAAAVAVGAHDVARALAAEAEKRGTDLRIVRTGTRGMLFLEPFLEVELDGVRTGYGPVSADDVPGLFDAGFLTGGAHALAQGPVEEIPWFKNQTRLTFARCGRIDPLNLQEYEAQGGLAGLRAALSMTGEQIIEQVSESGLRGRGGAGFPAAIKWKTVAAQPDADKFVVCNADEGDSGTFADRIIMEGDPSTLIEGMVIAAIAVGARDGFIYIRSEYPHAIARMKAAVKAWEEAGWLGADVLGSGKPFHFHIRTGAGSYVCGEESAMLESLEGKRGEVRAKPPIPALKGLFGKPTVVNNVLSFAAVPEILAQGGKAYAAHGMERSRGTTAWQLAGNIRRGGLYEAPFGITLRELIEEIGGGTLSGRPIRAVQVGGPLGAYLPESMLDLPMDYEAFLAAGAMVGHGGIVVFDDTVDMAKQARFAMEFCAVESCGKCTPCRIGSVRGAETVDRIAAGTDVAENVALLEDLCETMTDGSLCAMGGLTPMPVTSALRWFPEDFGLRSQTGDQAGGGKADAA